MEIEKDEMTGSTYSLESKANDEKKRSIAGVHEANNTASKKAKTNPEESADESWKPMEDHSMIDDEGQDWRKPVVDHSMIDDDGQDWSVWGLEHNGYNTFDFQKRQEQRNQMSAGLMSKFLGSSWS